MTKSKTKLDLEITLERLEIGTRRRYNRGVHQLDVSLLWPRTGIALRSAGSRIVLQNGLCDLSAVGWHRRVLFKESCSDTFAMCLEISVSMTRSMLKSLPRKFAGYIFKTAGDYIDDLGAAGEVAEQPLKEISRSLLDNKPPATMGHGAVDLNVADFADGVSHEVVIEIFSGDGDAAGGNGKLIGEAYFKVKALS